MLRRGAGLQEIFSGANICDVLGFNILVFPVERRFRDQFSKKTLLQGARPRASINQLFQIFCAVSVASFDSKPARAPPPRSGRLQAHRRTDPLTTISPFAIDLRAPFAACLEARAPRRRCALTP